MSDSLSLSADMISLWEIQSLNNILSQLLEIILQMGLSVAKGVTAATTKNLTIYASQMASEKCWLSTSCHLSSLSYILETSQEKQFLFIAEGANDTHLSL